MSKFPWWLTAPLSWAIAHPAETFVIGYGLRYAPVPIARGLWATGTIMGPATLQLGGALAKIAYESSGIIRLSTAVLATTGILGGITVTAAATSAAVVTAQDKLISTLPEAEQAVTRKGYSQALTGTGPGIGTWAPSGGWS
jgi:hypothetical protein